MYDNPANTLLHRATIYDMAKYARKDSTGARLRWARKRMGWGQEEVCSRVNIGVVYLSALENDKRAASRETMARLAEVLGVSRAFLEMETDIPDPLPNEPAAQANDEPDHWSAEADKGAQLIDSMSPDLREIAVDLLRVLAMHDTDGEDADSDTPATGPGKRLILGKLLGNLKKSAGTVRPTSRMNSE